LVERGFLWSWLRPLAKPKPCTVAPIAMVLLNRWWGIAHIAKLNYRGQKKCMPMKKSDSEGLPVGLGTKFRHIALPNKFG